MNKDNTDKPKQTRSDKHKNKLSKKKWIAICAACGAAVAVLAVFLIRGNEGDSKVYEDLKDTAVIEESVTPAPTPTVQPTQKPDHDPLPDISIFDKPYIQHADKNIDFNLLESKNPDIFAWISVPGTEIDYPIVMSLDNADYLQKDIDGKENKAGSIFMDMSNHLNFSDRNTVIYGHNMKNGSMFAGLHKFEEPEFFEQNRTIKIYIPGGGMLEYEIIAAYLTDNQNILYERDFTNDKVYKEYIDSIFNNTDKKANLLEREIEMDERLITLSTCERGQDEKRYVVIGVLKSNENQS